MRSIYVSNIHGERVYIYLKKRVIFINKKIVFCKNCKILYNIN